MTVHRIEITRESAEPAIQACAVGNRTVKVAPLPNVLSMVSRP
jgi:hypothetical protein